jgi:hypothetical protein
VIFLVNGQAHGHLDKTFFKRKRVNMSYIADDILVLVDATSLDGRAREDLFMNSRDRLRDGSLRRAIERELESLLAEHQLLRELRQKRREDALSKKLQDDRALEEVLRDIIQKSPSLAALFITGKRLSDPFNLRKGGTSTLDFVGQRFPTYFRLMKGNERRSAHLGQRFRVQFETDAENLYFHRDLEPGLFQLEQEGEVLDAPPPNLLNGIATLNLQLPAGAKVGDILRWDGQVIDALRPDPFLVAFERVVQPPEQSGGGTGTRRKRADPEGDDRQVPRAVTLPPITSVHKGDWGLHGFDRDSALAVKPDAKGGWDFFVNADNVHLRWEAKATPHRSGSLEAQFKYAMALIGLAILKERPADDGDGETDIEAEVERTTRALSPVILPMIAGLADLEADLAAGPDEEGTLPEDADA